MELRPYQEEARRAVEGKKRELPELSEMCTTVAGCVFLEDRTFVFHAGDSRVYRYDGTSLARMTVDHSAVQSMVDAGRMSAEDGRKSPQRNIITRCIGMDCPPPEIYVSQSPVLPGEVFLLCSDGLWECMPDEELKAEANKWELSHGGISGRTAQQFVNYLDGQRSEHLD